jgi:SAM-dependent methyltransferase
MLKQQPRNLGEYDLLANKFWQNAVMAQVLWERKLIQPGCRALGFGVGQERLPALFARYGVDVTATDQDFKRKKAGYWAKHELAKGTQSLNSLRICPPAEFAKRVEYQPVDMNDIPTELHDSYDFLWSNCALGHLGSIPNGLRFIEESLKCLKPGGTAVHTTELNILSNQETVTGGDTVIFRIRDMYELSLKLLEAGYIMRPFTLKLGNTDRDKRISFRPQFGNDYSKIQVMGHLATQIVLIISKPIHKLSAAQKLSHTAAIKRAYAANKMTINRYRTMDQLASPIIKAQKSSASAIKLVARTPVINVKLTAGKSKRIRVVYDNESRIPIFSTYARLGDSHPIVLATAEPNDRKSRFRDPSWPSKNRVTTEFLAADMTGEFGNQDDYLRPKQACAFDIVLNAEGVAKGSYNEHFRIVQEHTGWVASSNVELQITVS